MRLSDRNIIGFLLFVGSIQFIFGMHIAEFLYPDYSVSTNFISDLGATCRDGTCVIHQPSAIIFNSSVTLLGLLILGSSYFIQRAFRRRVVTVLLALAGVGAAGVGIFPENFPVLHGIASFITFLFGGAAVIALSQILKGLLRYLGTLLGAATLIAMFLFILRVDLGLGIGGMERMIAFPALLAAVGFGGYLMSSQQ